MTYCISFWDFQDRATKKFHHPSHESESLNAHTIRLLLDIVTFEEDAANAGDSFHDLRLMIEKLLIIKLLTVFN